MHPYPFPHGSAVPGSLPVGTLQPQFQQQHSPPSAAAWQQSAPSGVAPRQQQLHAQAQYQQQVQTQQQTSYATHQQQQRRQPHFGAAPAGFAYAGAAGMPAAARLPPQQPQATLSVSISPHGSIIGGGTFNAEASNMKGKVTRDSVCSTLRRTTQARASIEAAATALLSIPTTEATAGDVVRAWVSEVTRACSNVEQGGHSSSSSGGWDAGAAVGPTAANAPSSGYALTLVYVANEILQREHRQFMQHAGKGRSFHDAFVPVISDSMQLMASRFGGATQTAGVSLTCEFSRRLMHTLNTMRNRGVFAEGFMQNLVSAVSMALRSAQSRKQPLAASSSAGAAPAALAFTGPSATHTDSLFHSETAQHLEHLANNAVVDKLVMVEACTAHAERSAAAVVKSVPSVLQRIQHRTLTASAPDAVVARGKLRTYHSRLVYLIDQRQELIACMEAEIKRERERITKSHDELELCRAQLKQLSNDGNGTGKT